MSRRLTITAIALGAVADEPLLIRVGALAAIGLLMTVGVYGVVAGIVKLDDVGLGLSQGGRGSVSRAIGGALLRITPYLTKGLSIAGTAAMFLVGGGIIAHGIPGAPDLIHRLTYGAARVPVLGVVLEARCWRRWCRACSTP
jgi:predicted DNA repair protein MutK